ncbi:glycosyltransferase family 1 protein [Spongiactinospora rosea]|uniref:Glycosyltransferase family 1 protein n=1 Tax=Spongiactinospora rosea TaxID=2248750 RepID=A0A366LYK8_9ACTN|nr:glycosyltransferase family 4 protein [Spongiactinospora rosea]RBQ19046.1 glycosyltransferase family 1 protein [Spongiactinospora rosea]
MDDARILLVLGTSAGGVGRHVRTLASGLVRRGHRVAVAGPRETQERFGFTETGAAFLAVPIADRPRPGGDLRAMAALRGAGADVVHAHGLRAGALAALALTGRRTPLAVTLHNALTAGGAVGAVYGVLERIVARRAGVVLPVSPDLGARMTDLGARRVVPAVVPAPPLPAAGRTPGETRAALDVPAGRPLLLTVARLAQQKGLETLLDAAAAVPDALFAVAGEGPLRGPLAARIAAEGLPVRLLGDRADMPDLFAAADAVVVPSRWEGQPLSLQEALRAGRPVIASAVGGIPGMLGEAGLLVPYGDVAALAGAVRRVLGEPGLAARLGKAAARRGAELPGEDDAVVAALAVYRSILGAAAGPGD